jgi:hypothetical protein
MLHLCITQPMDSALVQHFMWKFRFLDPYQAVSYDLLHFDEPGKWGHHLWPLIPNLLGELHLPTEMTDM